MKLDNKKLVKYLVISGTGLLIVFIVARLAFKNSGDTMGTMPVIGELEYEPEKIKEASKIEQFEEQKKDNERKAMGYDNSQYIVPSFSTLADKPAPQQQFQNSTVSSGTGSGQTVSTRPSVAKTYADQQDGNYYRPVNSSSSGQSKPPAQKSSGGAKLNYQSNYFKEETPAFLPEATKEDNAPASENPFGTITSGNSGGQPVQKQISNQVHFYTAEIYGDQKIEDGGMVLIRNTISLQYQDHAIPRNSILYGQAVFKGNRVFVNINRAKTPTGEYSVSFGVKDNDRVDGLYFKAPIDESVDKTKEGVAAPSLPIPGTYGKIINSAAQSVVQGGKELMKRSSSLNLEEGYKLYLILK